MSTFLEQFRSQLTGLPTGERAELALFLIHSLDTDVDADADDAWDAELQRRVAEIDGGKAVGIPAEQVFAELRKPRS